MFTLEKTKIGKEVGQGYYAKIYEYGEQIEGKKNHLVKCIPVEDVAHLQQHLEEFALGFNNKHPFVLNYKGLYTEEVNEGKTKYKVYIKMLKMKQNLRQFISNRKKTNQPIPRDEFIRIFFSLATALFYLEEKDIVHGNIMHDSVFFFGKKDTVKLRGFVFSKYKPWNPRTNTSKGKIAQSYLPPEERDYKPAKMKSAHMEKKKVEKKSKRSDEQIDEPLDLFGANENQHKIEGKEEVKTEEMKESQNDKKEKKEVEKEDVKNAEDSFDLFDEDVNANEKEKIDKEAEKIKEVKKEEFKENEIDQKKEKEKKKAEKAVAFKKDVWCLGKLMIDICLLRDSVSRETTFEDINKKVETDLKQVCEEYPDSDLQRILKGMLVAKRKDRPTFRQISEDLQKSYPHLELLEMEDKKIEERQPGDFNASEIAPEEEKVEDLNGSLTEEPASVRQGKLIKKISEEHRTLQDDIEIIKQTMESEILDFKQTSQRFLEEIQTSIKDVADHKIEISTVNVEGFLKKAENLLDKSYTSLETLSSTYQEIKTCLTKYDQDKSSSIEESQRDIFKPTGFSKLYPESFEYHQETSQKPLSTNFEAIYKDQNKE